MKLNKVNLRLWSESLTTCWKICIIKEASQKIKLIILFLEELQYICLNYLVS